MKHLNTILKPIALIIFMLLSIITHAQQGINYQGVARNAEGELLLNTDIDLKFNINTGTPEGTSVYSETHTTTTDINGVFSLVIGEGSPVLNTFEDINWAEDKHFLNVWLNNEEIGTTEFMGTPYTNAIGKWQAHKNGVTSKGTGGSIYVGDNAGENDDLNSNYNIGLGLEVLKSTTIGHNNLALGKRALRTNRDGYENIAMGIESLHNNISGNFNIGIGSLTLYGNTTGNKNIAIGDLSLHHNLSGDNNIAFGELALYKQATGSNNIAIGKNALSNSTVSNRNIAIGQDALLQNETEMENIAIGYSALSKHNDGISNIAIGGNALSDHVSGVFNVAIGPGALDKNLTGDRNVAIGVRAGGDCLGARNVFIGPFSGTHDVFENVDNKLIIDNHTSSLPLIYGDFIEDLVTFNAKVGIGTQEPNAPLHIKGGDDVSLGLGSGQIILGREENLNLALDNNEIQARNAGLASDLYLQSEGGNVRVGGAIVHASDKRLKRDILNISYGLKEVLELRPTEYFWKERKQEHKSLGLIAQEVNEVIKNVVTYDENEDRYGVSYTELIPVLIKALQEQQHIIDNQNNTIKTFEARLTALEGKMSN